MDELQISVLLKTRLSRFVDKDVSWDRLAKEAVGLNYAEINRAADEVLKAALIDGRECPKEADIRVMLKERQNVARKLKGNI